MTVEQVKQVIDKFENISCPLTEKLIQSGFQQKDGYINYAKEDSREVVDFTKAKPSQKWHFYTSFYDRADKNSNFRFYPCGEFLFWLAEILNVKPKDYSLDVLLEKVIETMKFKNDIIEPKYLLNKSIGNNLIKEQCWDGIKHRLNEEIRIK